MGMTYLHAVASLDGYIADERDDVGPLHDWYFNGDHPLVDEDHADVHGAPFRVSAASADYVRGLWSRQKVLVIGRHQIDVTNGWTVIWDNLGAHHAGDLAQWAAAQSWLVLAYLPSYAPELDPVEGLWANLKGCELANRCCADRTELIATAQVGSIRVRRDPDLLRSFLAGTGLTL